MRTFVGTSGNGFVEIGAEWQSNVRINVNYAIHLRQPNFMQFRFVSKIFLVFFSTIYNLVLVMSINVLKTLDCTWLSFRNRLSCCATGSLQYNHNRLSNVESDRKSATLKISDKRNKTATSVNFTAKTDLPNEAQKSISISVE